MAAEARRDARLVSKARPAGDSPLWLIGGFKLAKGVALLRRRWAEYFTVIVTGSLIPLEVYELLRRVTLARLIFLSVNVVVVWYLIAVLRRPVQKGRVMS